MGELFHVCVQTRPGEPDKVQQLPGRSVPAAPEGPGVRVRRNELPVKGTGGKLLRCFHDLTFNHLDITQVHTSCEPQQMLSFLLLNYIFYLLY